MIILKQHGNFNHTDKFLSGALHMSLRSLLEAHAMQGVISLTLATPKDTGLTANSWSYKIETTKTGYTISWMNSNVNDGVPIVILLQYGHGTGNGGYVEGRDFINPAIRPIVDKLANTIFEEVARL